MSPVSSPRSSGRQKYKASPKGSYTPHQAWAAQSHKWHLRPDQANSFHLKHLLVSSHTPERPRRTSVTCTTSIIPVSEHWWLAFRLLQASFTDGILSAVVGRGRVGAPWQQAQKSWAALSPSSLCSHTYTILVSLQLFTTIVLSLDLPTLKSLQHLCYSPRCPTGYQCASYKQHLPLLCLAKSFQLVSLQVPPVSD